MKTILIAIILGVSINVAAQTTGFTYQGALVDGTSTANGSYDFEFRLFDAESGGLQLGSTLSRSGVAVTNGIFSVSLDFGFTFPGPDRFLEIRVRSAGGGGFTALSPRQKVTSAPYAIRSVSAENANEALTAATANNALALGGVVANQFVITTDPRMSDSRPPTPGSPSYVQNTTNPQASSNFNITGNGTAGGTLTGGTVNATTQFNLGGNRILTSFFGSTFLGVGSGNTGSSNAFFGVEAGQANSAQGGANSFFGRFSGHSNTNGSDNSFFGSDSGQLNTTGNQNSFFGRSAGFASTEGSQNSFFGRSAGLFTTTGDGNTFVGANSGFSNTTGSNNSLIGSSANIGPNVSFGTAIGSGAVATQSNSVVLGRSIDTVRIPGNLDVTGNFTGNFTVPAANINGVLATANGGTGIASPGASGNFLRSNGSAWTSSSLAAADIPTGSGNYVQNQNAVAQSATNFNIAGTGTANIFTAATQYNIGSNRFLSGNATSLFVGINAGNLNTAGSSNTFVGAETGKSMGLGNSNSFFGTSAGESITSGANNSFFGSVAGRDAVGSNNSFFGHASGFKTSGISNSFFGQNSGNDNTTGESNTFVGRSSGTANVSGSHNTLLGEAANVGAANLSYATAIGSEAIVSTSNSVVLGRPADTVRVPGNLGVDTTSPVAKLHVDGGTDAELTDGSSGYIVVGTLASANIVIDNNEIMARNFGAANNLFLNAEGGNVGIGDNVASDKLDVNGDIRVGTSGTNGCLKNNNGGTITGTCSSDERFKRDITPFTSVLSRFTKLRPVHYFFRANEFPEKHFGPEQTYGLLAQDVEKVLPELVSTDANGFKQIDYGKLPMLTIQAVKELNAKNESLQEQINTLKAIVCQLQSSTAACRK